MKANYQAGFTIVEVMLFLAITGLMAVVMLGGWTTMINTQRYNDSVRTYQAFLQQQYNLVYNVQSERDGGLECDAGGVSAPPGGGSFRGQTNCLIIGRYLHVQNGTDIDVYPIYGVEPASSTPLANSDLESFEQYNLQRVTDNSGMIDSKFVIPWGTAIINAPTNTDRLNYNIVIIRSPLTGIVHTYAERIPNNTTLRPVDELVDTTNEDETVMCLDPGTAFSGGGRAVVIKKGASSQSFIETRTSQQGECA